MSKNPFLGLGLSAPFSSFSRVSELSGIDCSTLPSGQYLDLSSHTSLSITTEEQLPRGLYISPDGLNLYTTGQTSPVGVDQYSLSTAWDITTASHVRFKSTSSEDTTPDDVYFKGDGTSMFVIGDDNDDIYEYTLSTAWNISTATYSKTYNWGTGNTGTSPTGLYFSPNGEYMFIYSSSLGYLNRFTLSTPWNITTASSKVFNNFAASQISANQETDIAFNPNGTRLALVSVTNTSIYEYSLSTPWDITTTSYLGSLSISADQAFPTGLTWGNNGKYLYIIGSTPDAVHRYETCAGGAYKILGRP